MASRGRHRILVNDWGANDYASYNGHSMSTGFPSARRIVKAMLIIALPLILLFTGFLCLRPTFRTISRRDSVRLAVPATTSGPSLRLFIPLEESNLARVRRLLGELKRSVREGGDRKIHLHFVTVGEVAPKTISLLDSLEWSAGLVNHQVWGMGTLRVASGKWRSTATNGSSTEGTAVDDASKDSTSISLGVALLRSWYPKEEEFAIFLDPAATTTVDGWLLQATTLLNQYFIRETSPTDGEREESFAAQSLLGISLSPEEPSRRRSVKGTWYLASRAPSSIVLLPPWSGKELLPFVELSNDRTVTWQALLEEYMRTTGRTLLFPGAGSGPPLHSLPVMRRRAEDGEEAEAEEPKNEKGLYNHSRPLMVLDSGHYRGMIPSQLKAPPTQRCLLDEFSDPILPRGSRPAHFMYYEPTGSVASQVDTLQRVLILADLLNRTLIIPPLVNPANESESVPFAWVYAANMNWLRISTFETFQFFAHPIRRHVIYERVAKQGKNPTSTSSSRLALLDTRGLEYGKAIRLPLLNTIDAQFVADLAGCHDEVLTLGPFEGLPSKLTFPGVEEHLLRLRRNWTFRPQLIWLMDELRSKWASPLMCVLVPRSFTNCHSLGSRLCDPTGREHLQKAQLAAQQLDLTPASIYLLRDAPGAGDEDERMLPQNYGDVPIYSAAHLADALWHKRSLDIPREAATLVASLVERELCRDVALFVSDPRSALGRLMVEVRRRQGLPAVILGDSEEATDGMDTTRDSIAMASLKGST